MNPTAPRDRRPQRIAVLPGDGIGKDVTAEAVKVLAAAAERWELPLRLEQQPWSADHYLATGETLPPAALASLRDDYAAILVGAYGDPRVPDMKHAADILLGIRFGLDLYINFRPVRLYDESLCPLKGKRREDVEFVVFRENTEGAYVGMGGNFKRDTADEVAIQEEVHTRKGVERILRAAFDWARAHRRTKVVMADKSNVMRYAHDLWQRAFRVVAAGLSRDRGRPHVRRRPGAADGARPGAVPGDGDQQHVRRHHHRPGGGAPGRSRRRRLGEPPPRPHLDVRAGARLGPEIRRLRPRQPGGRGALRRP